MNDLFTIKANDGYARSGELNISGKKVTTPVFMPCGTKGAIKGLTQDKMQDLGINLYLCNTYHLMLRPGEDLIYEKGGLHKWINWNDLILTDSGGFQVFSLGNLNKISDQGVEFSSYLNGEKRFITPEDSIEIQFKLGADIIMAFDECAPGDSSHNQAKIAMERTHRWIQRCIDHYKVCSEKYGRTPLLFPIAQGVIYDDLRVESVKFMANLDLPGIAIGGLSVGESKDDMYRILAAISPHLPNEKPRYLMGVGSPEDIVEGIFHGIDMFDCVLPTRLARHNSYFTDNGRQTITNAKNTKSDSPLMENCDCYTCKNHSQSYLRHLAIENEMNAAILLTTHNLRYLKNLTDRCRKAIEQGIFSKFHAEFMAHYLGR